MENTRPKVAPMEQRDMEFLRSVQGWDTIQPKCSVDKDGNRTYTFYERFFINWPETQENRGKEYRYARIENFGFLRAICDKSGKLLAYTCVMPIVPDPFPSKFHRGAWYAFEEYHPELIPDFKISVNSGMIMNSWADWQYKSDKNRYEVLIPTILDGVKHWFVVEDKQITADYNIFGADVRTYAFDTRPNTPNPKIVELIKQRLIMDGIIPKPVEKRKSKIRMKYENFKHRLHGGVCKAFSRQRV